ncbi:aminoimidazole riboside kinase [Shigella flexneri]|uniref:Aminoimidazole riboside kinase n=1 Tax=Shigella flexneri TaxID=623 RepID=A0A658Z5X8_SHIFL|nr:aminoimidazole riboside kinase [Shigella flexneri]
MALNIPFRNAYYRFALKWHTEFGHLNRGDMLTSEQHRYSNEKKKF